MFADLRVDADWVILSACNTAAGGVQGAEALSGLARAFFYAGARSLLVSHWEVGSESTVKLITKAIAELKADPKIGRAEALRRSILSMIDTGKDYEVASCLLGTVRPGRRRWSRALGRNVRSCRHDRTKRIDFRESVVGQSRSSDFHGMSAGPLIADLL
jgi:CHAT domain-containing protein